MRYAFPYHELMTYYFITMILTVKYWPADV